ncbi:unnamed protein product [Discosporangium mesarthrocarpum]
MSPRNGCPASTTHARATPAADSATAADPAATAAAAAAAAGCGRPPAAADNDGCSRHPRERTPAKQGPALGRKGTRTGAGARASAGAGARGPPGPGTSVIHSAGASTGPAGAAAAAGDAALGGTAGPKRQVHPPTGSSKPHQPNCLWLRPCCHCLGRGHGWGGQYFRPSGRFRPGGG